MHVPNEIVLAIVPYVGQRDLKALRLVSKTWHDFASELLFRKIYVSPNKLDFEAFEALTQRSDLNKHVRRLTYDGAEFIVDCPKRRYIKELRRQWSHILIANHDTSSLLAVGGSERGSESKERTPWYNVGLAELFHGELETDESLELTFESTGFIAQGYRKHLEHARYQQDAILNGSFIEGLFQGLARVPSLESVTVKGAWPYISLATHEQHRFGSPLARTWDPFHLCPQEWHRRTRTRFDDHDGYDRSHYFDDRNGNCHYRIITTALVRAKREIREFALGRGSLLPHPFPGIPPYSILGLDAAAFKGLHRLYLKIAPVGGLGKTIEGLPKLLASIESLQHLDLVLPFEHWRKKPRYRFDEVFPGHTEWKKLENLVLYGVSSGATELLNLLLFRMPALKNLEFGEIELRDGTWEGVIECLKQSRRVWESCYVRWNTLLLYNDDSLDVAKTFLCPYALIEGYMLRGGRHPSLKDDQQDAAAGLYMMDKGIDPALRDRIVGAQT